MPNQTEAPIVDLKSSQEEADLYLYPSYTLVGEIPMGPMCVFMHQIQIRPGIISYATPE